MRSIIHCLLYTGLAAGMLFSTAEGKAPADTTKKILESYVEDFRLDPAAADARKFGIRISGKDAGEWHVVVGGSKDSGGKWKVELRNGQSNEPTFVYAVDSFTLAEIDAGRINGLTVQGKAYSSDITPMAVDWMPGAKKFDVNSFSFHFWTRGFPEKVPFRSGGTRIIHNSGMGVFYYEKGFRSAWSKLAKGQGANNGPGRPLIAPFTTLVFVTEGKVNGKVNDKPVTAKAGEMIFIPAMTPHEWWNENEEPAEAILIFFGKGA